MSKAFGVFDGENQAIQSGLVILDAKGAVLMIARGAGLHPEASPSLLRHAIGG